MGATGAARPPGTDLAAARDATDLIPANVRALGALDDAVGTGIGGLSDAASTLVRTTTGLPWSGTAADAFATHRRTVVDRVDRWDEAADLVRTVLHQHQAAILQARNTACDALEVWRSAQRQAAQAAQWATPPASLAANADTLRAHLHAIRDAALRRATTLLQTARTGLVQAGDHAAETVYAAVEILRTTPLPELVEVGAATTLTATMATADGGGIPGWPGATAIVRAPCEGVHDTLARIAARDLGDAGLWPQIYQLNVGQPVGGNAVLTDPNVVQPGWILWLPDIAHAASVVSATGPPYHHALHTCAICHHSQAARQGRHEHSIAVADPTSAQPTNGDATPGGPTAAPPEPTAPGPQPGARPGPASPPPSPATPLPPRSHPTPSLPAPAGPAHAAQPVTNTAGHGVNLGAGLVLAGGVATALAATVLATGAHRRRHPRRGATTPMAGEPVVHRLTASQPDLPPPPGPEPAGSGPFGPAVDLGSAVSQAGPARAGWGAVPFGHRDGRTVLIDIAATLGLGLAGPGALDAARAVLVSTLATDPRATVILSDADRHRLLPADSPAAASVARTSGSGSSRSVSDQWSGGRVTVTGRASSMLDYLEAEILTRTRLLEDSHGQITLPPLLVISTVPADTRRLQAVADLGAGLGITMVVLGGWPAGITCFITADGRIGDVRGRHVDEWHLPGLRAFTAGARDTADLLALLTAPSQRSGPPLTGRRARPADPPPVHNPVDGPRTDAAGQAAHSPVIDPATVSPQTTIPGSATLDPAPATTTDGHPPSHGPDSPTHRPGTQDTTPVTSGLTQIAQRLSATDLSTTVAADNVTETDREPTLTIAVLGEVRLFHGTRSADATDAGREITSAIGPRLRELVAFVALHPDGVRRDEVSDALWPDTTPHRHTHALNSALARLRRAASRATGDTVDDLFLRSDQRLRLDPGRVSVDVWEFHRAWDAARAATDTSTRAQAYRRMIDAYGGPLANDVDADWIAAPRQSLHRAATDAVSSLARLLVDKDPQQTLDLLDSARVWDPYNEHLYRDIMRLQARLGQTDAIGRTLELLGVRLAEISAAPSVQTQALAAGLQQRAESSAPDPAATSPTAASPTVARPTSSPGQSGQGTP